MKKSIINLFVCATLISISGGVIASTDQMFSSTQSKEWGATPQNVREALKDIKVMSGSSAKDMMSKNWLNELKRSPSTYNLNKNDVAWIEGMIRQSRGDSWNPKIKVSIPKNQEPSVTVKKSDPTSTIAKVEEKPAIKAQSFKMEERPVLIEVKENKTSEKTTSVSTDRKVKTSDPWDVKPANSNNVKEKDVGIKESDRKEQDRKAQLIAKEKREQEERARKLKAEKAEREKKIAQLTSEIDMLKADEKIISEIERIAQINKNIYNETLEKVGYAEQVKLLLDKEYSYDQISDSVDTMKYNAQEANEIISETEAHMASNSEKERSQPSDLQIKDVEKNTENTTDKNDAVQSQVVEGANTGDNIAEVSPVAPTSIAKENNEIVTPSKELISQSNSKVEQNNELKKQSEQKMNEILSSMKESQDKISDEKTKSVHDDWKVKSAVLISGFSLFSLFVLSIFGFKKDED